MENSVRNVTTRIEGVQLVMIQGSDLYMNMNQETPCKVPATEFKDVSPSTQLF